MADELVLYTNPMSRGRIARWMLEEIGQPYRTEVLDYATTMKAPAYLAVNPMGKVPALRHGDAVVTETAAICAYLADAFPQAEARAAAGRPPARPLLPLAVLLRRPGRGGGQQQGARLRGAGRARADDRLRQHRARHERARGGCIRRELSGWRQLHCRRSLRRLAARLRHDVWHHREAARIRAILAADQCPAGLQTCQGNRRRARRRGRAASGAAPTRRPIIVIVTLL